jgi:hypothetical protein
MIENRPATNPKIDKRKFNTLGSKISILFFSQYTNSKDSNILNMTVNKQLRTDDKPKKDINNQPANAIGPTKKNATSVAKSIFSTKLNPKKVTPIDAGKIDNSI